MRILTSSLLFLSWTLLLSVHAQEKTAALSPPPKAGKVSATRDASPQSAGKSYLITETSMGPVAIGMKMSELKKKLGKGYTFKTDKNFMVDIEAVTISKNGEALVSILFPVGEPQEYVDWIVTSNPKFTFKNGVGPGTKVADAAKKWGKPHLSFSTYDEQREWLDFTGEGVPEKQRLYAPARFRTNEAGNKNAGQIGLYPFVDKRIQEGVEYFETDQYKPDGEIHSVWLEMAGC